MDTELETKKVIVVLAAGRRAVNDFILARQYGFQRKAGFSSGIIVVEVQEDFLNLRLLIEVLHKSRRGSAVLDSLLGQIHTGEGNKVVFPPIPARHLFKRRIGKQVNGALKKVYRAAVAVCDPKRIVLVTAGAVTQNTAVIGRSVGRIARSIFLIKAHAHKIVIRQALENQPLVNAALDDGIVDAPAEKILCNFICGSTFIRQKQDLTLSAAASAFRVTIPSEGIQSIST